MEKDMNAETFTNFIKNPHQLYKIPYTELKNLVTQYPYCQNLRYLLLHKCAFDGNSEFEENLNLAATFVNDRNKLFRQIQKKQKVEKEIETVQIKEESKPGPSALSYCLKKLSEENFSQN